MAASSEERRYAQSVTSFMELCADIHPSLRKTIANSNPFRTFVLSLSEEGSTENVAVFREAYEKCAQAWKEVLEERSAEKKRKAQELEGSVNPSKRTKLSCAPDEDNPEPLEAKEQTMPRDSPSTNEQSTSHAAEEHIPLSPTISDNSASFPKEMAPPIHSASSRATTPEDEAHISTLDDCSDTETSDASSDSRESDTITQHSRALTTVSEEDSYATPHTGIINTVTSLVQSHAGACGHKNISSTLTITSTPADNHATLATVEELDQDAGSSNAANGQLVIADVSTVSDSGFRSTKEYGITLGSPAITAPIKDHCLSWQAWYRHRHRESNIDDILNVCTRFNFDIAKYKLLRYLNGRPAPTSSETSATPVPLIWDMSETLDIVNALQIIGCNDKHAKIQRAYAQMKLFALVEEKTTGGLMTEGSGKHVSEHLIFLEELAMRRTATVSMQDSIERRYTAAYFAGKRWKELVGWFGGVGSVLIFVTLGIGNSYVEHSWNEFQRACFEYIAKDLLSIKKLVRAMGDDVLEQYCRFGNLTDDLRGEIKRVEGYC